MYTRKHHKEDSSVRGRNPGWKDTFSIDDKGGEIHQMQRTEAWFSGGEMVTEMKRTEACFQREHE
jgi:hypothetical protein